MGKYFAMVKYTGSGKPMSTGEFTARDHADALNVMLAKAKVQSTMNLHEYELLHVVGRNYQRVFYKISDKPSKSEKKIETRKEKQEEVKAPEVVKDMPYIPVKRYPAVTYL